MASSAGRVTGLGDARVPRRSPTLRAGESVTSISVHPSGDGYWLFTSLGRAFAYGDGYLMVGTDGGIFSFSSKPSVGSLGGRPIPDPIVAVAAR